jgi:hypothetical protein
MQRIYTESSKANADATYHWIARLLFGWLVPDMGRMFRWFGEEVSDPHYPEGINFFITTSDRAILQMQLL